MARVKQKTRKQAPSGGASTRGAQVAKERQKHTVIVEGTSKEHNKLRSVITFRADPPKGYTFIPAGNPELTAALKEFARRGDHKIYAVTTTPHAERHELSREVHRIGFHFPTSVVAQVCSHYGIRLTAGGKVIDDSKDDKLFQSVYQNGKRPKEEPKDQITINTEAKQTIKDLFPKMPDNDLFQIIKTAFQLGDNKVGTADEIPLIRRAQLSVVAHIRHVYTDYDKLLRRCPYNEARHAVEKDTLAKLIEWRGDDEVEDEATQRAADDLLREVIVISDEEDDDETDTDDIQIVQDNVRVEELPSTAYGAAVSRHPSPYHNHPGEMVSRSYQALPPAIQRYKPSDDTIAQRDRSRYAVWDQARRDYRAGISRQPVTVLERIYEPIDVAPKRVLVPLDPPAHSPTQVVYSRPPPAPMNSVEYEPRHNISQRSPRSYIRDANGTLYERIDDDRPRERVLEQDRHFENAARSILAPEVRVRARPRSPQRRVYPTHRQEDEYDSGKGSVLESIEGPQGAYSPAAMRLKQNDGYPAPHDTTVMREDGLGYRGAPNINRGDDGARVIKRIRLEDLPSPSEQRYARRESPIPIGYRERVYMPQPDPHFATSRAIEYDNQRSSPTLRPAASLGQGRYAQSIAEINRAAYSSTGASRKAEAMFEHRDPPQTRSQMPLYAQEHTRYLLPEPSLRRRGIENQPPTVVSRVYEPLDDLVYDSRLTSGQPVAPREVHRQAPARVYEYDESVPDNARSYVHLAR
ncbi:hypothetical protein PV08_08185 [Exophiala spinifera]|uniref:DUF2293 domain-containing protein n=1 Tax=Exophiala spinifera TaxID=91928 RepID=A0A0D2B2B1_9EURO|nr:uncharacterized protein PV08_08185 [Exophiala spinifera]KIW12998.1 hypothetical protein PV08_08185 [Exophiala spinifera]